MKVLYFSLVILTATFVKEGLAQESRLERDTGPIEVSETDWAWWRGPQRNGVADANQDPPLEWSRTKNILWKTPVPGRGHSSPIVVRNRIYLTTADHEADTQSVICFDHDSGKIVWQKVVHDGGITKKGNKRASQASSTLACDGRRLFVCFLNRDAIFTTALNMSGNLIWQQRISDYTVHQGYGASPAINGLHVIVTSDNKGGKGVVAALNRLDGKIVWKVNRPKTPNYPSPIILMAGGKKQLFLTGCNLVSSFDPASGKKNWELSGATTECVTSTVTDGTHIYSSGGYPKNHVAAIRADGSGKVVWENKTRVYVPSMLIHDGHLYAVADAGFAVCWDSATGEEKWKKRLGGTFNASPVLVGNRIFATNEDGTTFVFKATAEEYVQVAENTLGDSVFATPTYCHDRVFMRVAQPGSDPRQEMLYCIGVRD